VNVAVGRGEFVARKEEANWDGLAADWAAVHDLILRDRLALVVQVRPCTIVSAKIY
jgi:hypothetical protein